MKHDIRIILDNDNFYDFKYSISNLFNISIIIENSNKEDFIKIITDYEKMRECFKASYELELKTSDDLHTLNTMKMFCDRKDSFYKYMIKSCEYIILESNRYEEIIEYINNNPEVLNNKILLPGYFLLNKEHLEDAEEYFKGINNIYVLTEGNDLPITLDEYRKTIEFIDNFVNEVKSLNFSPLEQIMYVYDKVRDRVYKKESTSESIFESRDITKVLFGDKIVCVGFAKIFDIILKKIGINTKIYDILSKDGNGGHERNVVYINDKKYDVEGIYYFDTTWDSKKGNDNNYLNKYKFFAITKKEIDKYTSKDYNDECLSKYSNDLDMVLIDLLKEKELSEIDVEFIDTINYLSLLVMDKKLITRSMYFPKSFPDFLKDDFNLNDTIDSIRKLIKLMNKPIKANILLEVLYNVRKIEYYKDSIKYPFDINNFYETLLNSNWCFDYGMKNLINVLFEEKAKEIYNNSLKNNMINFIKQEELDKKIAQVKLTKTLRKVLDKKMKDEL